MKKLSLFSLVGLLVIAGGCTKQQIENNCCESNWRITTQNFKMPNRFRLLVPQAFTPNGDGLNDQFFPIGQGWDLEKLVIKKGTRTVYESTDRVDAFWDGGTEKDGQYKYFMTFRATTGDSFEAEGRVCVMRYGERDGKLHDVERAKICECSTMDMMDANAGIVRQSEECPSNANIPLQ